MATAGTVLSVTLACRAQAQVAKNRVFRECVDKEKNQRLFGNHHRVRRPSAVCAGGWHHTRLA